VYEHQITNNWYRLYIPQFIITNIVCHLLCLILLIIWFLFNSSLNRLVYDLQLIDYRLLSSLERTKLRSQLSAKVFVEKVFEESEYANIIGKCINAPMWFAELDETHIISLIYEFSDDSISKMPCISPKDLGSSSINCESPDCKGCTPYHWLTFAMFIAFLYTYSIASVDLLRGIDWPWIVPEIYTCMSTSNNCDYLNGQYSYELEILSNKSECYSHTMNLTSQCNEIVTSCSKNSCHTFYYKQNAEYNVGNTTTYYRKNETIQQNPNVCDMKPINPKGFRKETRIIAYVYHFIVGVTMITLLALAVGCTYFKQK